MPSSVNEEMRLAEATLEDLQSSKRGNDDKHRTSPMTSISSTAAPAGPSYTTGLHPDDLLDLITGDNDANIHTDDADNTDSDLAIVLDRFADINELVRLYSMTVRKVKTLDVSVKDSLRRQHLLASVMKHVYLSLCNLPSETK